MQNNCGVLCRIIPFKLLFSNIPDSFMCIILQDPVDINCQLSIWIIQSIRALHNGRVSAVGFDSIPLCNVLTDCIIQIDN